MVVAVASGKGGTGKTTVAVNLARVFGERVQLLDSDVEEPNAHLFFPAAQMQERYVVSQPVPYVDEKLCNACGECALFCRFNAIVSFSTTPLVFPELCHSCGGCAVICPQKAITEMENRIGEVEILVADNIRLIKGVLDVGKPMAPPLIRATLKYLEKNTPAIIDAPPGTSCPVIAALRGVDFALLVAEPTAFGLNDLALAVEVLYAIDVEFAVVINRDGSGDDRVKRFCDDRGIEVIASIPYDRRIAEIYAHGRLIVDAIPAYLEIFVNIKKRIQEKGAR
ncbi:MAG: ATP-binding protein [Deltaproteobacteria bacterium]|nr:ATP-binding protein [Deltaproteobacteria bacterium]